MLPLWHFFVVQIRFPGEYWLWSNLTACYRIALCREQWTCRCRHSDWWFVKCDKECIRWHWIRFLISGHRVTDRFWGTNAALWLLSEPEGKLSALFVTGCYWYNKVMGSHPQFCSLTFNRTSLFWCTNSITRWAAKASKDRFNSNGVMSVMSKGVEWYDPIWSTRRSWFSHPRMSLMVGLWQIGCGVPCHLWFEVLLHGLAVDTVSSGSPKASCCLEKLYSWHQMKPVGGTLKPWNLLCCHIRSIYLSVYLYIYIYMYL